MTRVLVTGANGFIGQHLVRALVDSGNTVRGLRHTPTPLNFVSQDEVEWIEADLANPSSLKGIAQSIDTVYHLGAIPRNDLGKSWNDFLEVNVKGTRELLRECDEAGVRRFVYTSTVEAAGYGDGINPRRELDEPRPDNNYGKSKLEAERIVLDGSWRMECCVVRLPMIYGPGTMLVVPKLFGMVRRGFYPLIGDGSAPMEFCYVANAVHGLRLAAQRPEAISELFYVSDERTYTIKEVVSYVAHAMGCKVQFVRIPTTLAYTAAACFELLAKALPFPPFVSPYSRKPFFTRETVYWTTSRVNMVSIEKAKSQLGYRPQVDIATGCRLTAEWLIPLLETSSR